MEGSIKLIAHRGNINGSLPERENTVSYIEEAIEKGFDVEIDIRAVEHKEPERQAYISPYSYVLGHDDGETEVAYEWLLLHSESRYHPSRLQQIFLTWIVYEGRPCLPVLCTGWHSLRC